LIDTNLIYLNQAGTVTTTHEATVTISDGKESFVFDSTSCTFDNNTLTVQTGELVASVTLALPTLAGSTLIGPSLTGTINNQQVTGTTPFSAIHMSVFAGTYYQPVFIPIDAPLEVKPDAVLEIKDDGSVWHNDGSGLVQVDSYSYNFAMFVISFPVQPKPTYTFEMGTAAAYGRVAGNSAKAGLLVSILPSNITPPPSPF
jgi:hypothetical protein